MCGIAGQYSPDLKTVFSVADVEAMLAPMQHRGPDGQGVYVDQSIMLGHLRLSIVDIEGGHQPMQSVNKTALVTFNGEIYNAAEIRVILEEKGYQFQTSHSDTEVILYSYLEWQEHCVQKFRGMFAFAIWDNEKKQLFLARDRLGIKPLYYTIINNVIAFASELKGLLTVKGFDKTLNPEAIEDYLTLGYIPDPKTVFKGCYKLPPGHFLMCKPGDFSPRPQKYWDIDYSGETNSDGENLQSELLSQLKEAVQYRLIADVPLGAFLSGGVDSSSVVSLMSELSDTSVKTCSIAVDDLDYDESDFADQVAELFKTDHSIRLTDPATGIDLQQLAEIFDEPFADSSAIPTLKVSATAREKVTVALSGDGGDEVFCGYRRQNLHLKEHKVRRVLPHWFRSAVFGFLGMVYPKFDFLPRIFRAKTTFQALAMHDSEAYCHSVSKTPRQVMNRLRSKKFTKSLKGYRTHHLFKKLYKKAPATTEMQRIKYIDFKTFLAGGVLTKVDRTSMHHSLEVRVPILDHKFVEWSTKVDDSLNLKGGMGKYIFKKAMEAKLPADILYRPKKGFAVPMGDWLKNDLADHLDALTTSKVLHRTGLLKLDAITRLVEEHRKGIKNHENTLWALLMLEASLAYLLGNQ